MGSGVVVKGLETMKESGKYSENKKSGKYSVKNFLGGHV